MKISEQRDSRTSMTLECIKKQRNRKDAPAKHINMKKRKHKSIAAAPVTKKKRIVRPLSNALFDSLESYDQVLSCASKGLLHDCSVPKLHGVLRVNGFQFFHYTKDYITKNFSVLSGVLFQTRFSSLITGDAVMITAVALEDSEVVQDLAALQWLDRASKDLVPLSPEEGTSLGEMQSACMSKMTLDGLTDDLVEPAGALSSLKTIQPGDTSVEGKIELVPDDCYRPDMSMIVMLDSIEAQSSTSMRSPDHRGQLCSQEDIVTNDQVFQLESGLLSKPSLPLVCVEEQPPYSSPPLGSRNNTGSAGREEYITSINHTSLANVGISDQAKAKLESEEEDMIEKFPPVFCQTLENSPSKTCSLPFINRGVISDQNHGTLALLAKRHIIFEPESKQLAQPNDEEVSEVKQQSSFSRVSSPGLAEESAQPCPPLFNSVHHAVASQEIHQAEMNSISKEKFDLIEKFAIEALELTFKEDDLSDIPLLDETSCAGSIQIMANVHNFVKLEEDRCSNSCHVQKLQLNSPVRVVSSPQQTSSNFVGFLGLLAQVSTADSNAFNCSNYSLEEEHACNSEARWSAKRLFMENDAEVSGV